MDDAKLAEKWRESPGPAWGSLIAWAKKMDPARLGKFNGATLRAKVKKLGLEPKERAHEGRNTD